MVKENQASNLSLQYVLLEDISAEPATVALLVISYWNPHHTQSTHSTIIFLGFFTKQSLRHFCDSILTLLPMIICKRMIFSSWGAVFRIVTSKIEYLYTTPLNPTYTSYLIQLLNQTATEAFSISHMLCYST